MKGRVAACGILLAIAACHPRLPAQPSPPAPRYVVGAPWQGAAGDWFYPRESFDYQTTGLAVVETAHPQALTADGEIYRPDLPSAAHQTLQLPAIVRVTNLESGRTLLLRINDRGPDQQGRVLAVTPAAARLLLMQPGSASRVRIEIDGDLSRRLAAQMGSGPRLDVKAAPVIDVQEQTLAAPGAVTTPISHPGPEANLSSSPLGEQAHVPDPLPPRLQQGVPDPQALWIDGGRFNQRRFAEQVSASIGGTVRSDGEGHQTVYSVREGPFQHTGDADAALDQARRAGVTGARIIVE